MDKYEKIMNLLKEEDPGTLMWLNNAYCEECNIQNNGCFQMKRGDVVILTSKQKKEQDILKEQFEKRGRT
ncbi:hypothetical protein [Butyricicoccus intestinisimiae]|uniref:Uncharacterized protein n=1 Tax=Butyricicoccus intestinisimiae TaxID=2841509 RepID=A0ABS6EUW0_9FIRM|nr:hypothetical protein [Butyricicoccus intestinisimiae]MBU5491255.1 hypothetical protein [Butyricicoccus intestinisimiae]